MPRTIESPCTLRERVESRTTIDEKCNYCNGNLSIPGYIFLAVEEERRRMKQSYSRKIKHGARIFDSIQEGFYVSPGGGYYCSKYCFHMFTED